MHFKMSSSLETKIDWYYKIIKLLLLYIIIIIIIIKWKSCIFFFCMLHALLATQLSWFACNQECSTLPYWENKITEGVYQFSSS